MHRGGANKHNLTTKNIKRNEIPSVVKSRVEQELAPFNFFKSRTNSKQQTVNSKPPRGILYEAHAPTSTEQQWK
jgi:hypothetical protein